MGRSVTLGNGRDIDKDIELCRTTNEKTSEQTIHVLMENHIPFTKSWINIPFFLRRKFHGASQICVINTNRIVTVRQEPPSTRWISTSKNVLS